MTNPYPNGVFVFEYLPVEGCEECEFFETACPECILYGEALKKAEKIGRQLGPFCNRQAKARKFYKHGGD